jgi:tetratricopeptide (TPR) repeat protein
MSRALLCLALVLAAASVVVGTSLEEYTQQAAAHRQSGDITQATDTMEQAVAAYPASSDAHSYLGLYLGMAAGKTQDFMEAGSLIQRSFSALDRAVSLDSLNPLARFHRGLLGVEVPEFLGKLDMGIADLELVAEWEGKSPGTVARDVLVGSYRYLGAGYQKRGAPEEARSAWQKVVELAPGTESAEAAEAAIARLAEVEQEGGAAPELTPRETPAIAELKAELEERPDDTLLLVDVGRGYVELGEYDAAEGFLRRAIELDPSDVEAYTWLALAIGGKAEKGYDERIALDTNLRTNLAFEFVRVLDQAVSLAPDDWELRLLRGTAGVWMPFFVGRLEQGIEDLNMVVSADVPDSARAEALFLLGMAHQKKAVTQWIEVATKYPGTTASQAVYDELRPAITRVDLSAYKPPVLAVEFVLGFRDELAPQTAVWVEDAQGEFVKTIYVSGFSGYAKEVQVNLPEWSESSAFGDVDGVTAASIDLGHHVYLWDLKDASGERVPDGEYTVSVEVSYWPSMQYQAVSAAIELGREEQLSVVEQGDLVPYLEIKYVPNR